MVRIFQPYDITLTCRIFHGSLDKNNIWLGSGDGKVGRDTPHSTTFTLVPTGFIIRGKTLEFIALALKTNREN